MNERMEIISPQELRRQHLYTAFLAMLCGIMVGGISMGVVYNDRMNKAEAKYAELMACDPNPGETVILRRDVAAHLTCDRRAANPTAWMPVRP